MELALGPGNIDPEAGPTLAPVKTTILFCPGITYFLHQVGEREEEEEEKTFSKLLLRWTSQVRTRRRRKNLKQVDCKILFLDQINII